MEILLVILIRILGTSNKVPGMRISAFKEHYSKGVFCNKWNLLTELGFCAQAIKA